MKAAVSRRIEVETAISLAEQIIEGFMLTWHDYASCDCGGPEQGMTCFCPGWADQEGSRFSYSPDHYGAYVELELAPNTLTLAGITVSGCEEIVKINLASGRVEYTHNGTRRSGGGLVWYILMDTMWETINNARDWRVVEIETSRPEWAVDLPLLEGRFGDGPANLEEELCDKAEMKLKNLRLCGVKLPEGVEIDTSSPTLLSAPNPDGSNSLTPWYPDLLGIHYRRAAANGVSL